MEMWTGLNFEILFVSRSGTDFSGFSHFLQAIDGMVLETDKNFILLKYLLTIRDHSTISFYAVQAL
jgi:hypothetical protein